MIVITQEDLCIIRHRDHLYSFRKEFLTEKIWQRLRLLPAFRNSYSIFQLDHKEEHALDLIFDKITGEQRSPYRYSEDLQRIYLVELIHFINKLPMELYINHN